MTDRSAVLLRPVSRSQSFSPIGIAGLQLWLKADSGVYQDAARTTPATADTDPVGGWADQSGQGNHLSQATAGFRPLLKLAQKNGLPSLLFDGTDDALTRTAFAMGDTGFSIFLVGSLLLAGTYPMWVTYGATNAGDWNFRCTGSLGRPSLVAADLNQGAGEPSAGNASGTTTAMNGAGFQLIDAHVTAADAWSIYQQGTLRDSRTVALTLPATRSLWIGQRPDPFGAISAHITEILIYNPVLSVADAAQIRAYLNPRWALY